ncbi:kinase-like protein [Xylariaceae sp. FL0255]|nr:kinase-like protein [Xylariaceae sp. FL0255]
MANNRDHSNSWLLLRASELPDLLSVSSSSSLVPIQKSGTKNPLTETKNIKEHFTSPWWEFEKLLGSGTYGFAVLLKIPDAIRENVRPPGGHERMAVKLSLSPLDDSLRDEINVLRQLHGAKHIVQMLGFCPDVETAVRNRPTTGPFTQPAATGQRRTVPSTWAFSGFVGCTGPALALEYLEYGDLLTLYNKCKAKGKRLPNRLLWTLFLCLLRATVGMAYPKNLPTGFPMTLETIPDKNVVPSRLCHNDLGFRNIMMTAPDDIPEHSVGVMFKMIDFGLAKDDAMGWRKGIYDAAYNVLYFIHLGIPSSAPVAYLGRQTVASSLLAQANRAPPFPWLDPELIDLLAKCMYQDAKYRPPLQGLLEAAIKAVAKPPDSFPVPTDETDEAIGVFIQEMVLDASG